MESKPKNMTNHLYVWSKKGLMGLHEKQEIKFTAIFVELETLVI